jgi:AcrR family transcriptional regulator
MSRAEIATPERGTGGGRRAGGRPRNASLDEAILLAARRRLMSDGYARLTIGDVAADAEVSRPTLYRRWSSKVELVIDALDYGFRQEQKTDRLDLDGLEPRAALIEAVRRMDPAYSNPDAMILINNLAGEASRVPELLTVLREHAVEPRVALLEGTITMLQDEGALRTDLDKHAITAMCGGAYFSAFYRGEDSSGIAEAVVAALWPAIAVERRGSSGSS